MISMSKDEFPDEELGMGKLTAEQKRQYYSKIVKYKQRTDNDLRYTKFVAQKFSNNPKLYSLLKSFYNNYFKITSPIHILPDFIIFADGRSGTTSLYEGMAEHPNVYHAQRKEIDFFDAEYQRGVGWYKHNFPFVWHKLFETKLHGKFLTGEASSRYLTHPHALKRIHKLIPKAKLIAIFRNPIDRALSFYNMQLANGREPLSFEEAIKAEKSRIEGEMERMERDENYYSGKIFLRYAYLTGGLYVHSLKKMDENFFKRPIFNNQS